MYISIENLYTTMEPTTFEYYFVVLETLRTVEPMGIFVCIYITSENRNVKHSLIKFGKGIKNAVCSVKPKPITPY